VESGAVVSWPWKRTAVERCGVGQVKRTRIEPVVTLSVGVLIVPDLRALTMMSCVGRGGC
jgi:hypothetical protein